LAFGLSLGLVLVTDLALGLWQYGWGTFHAGMPAVYASYALIALLGMTLQNRRTPLRIGGATLGAAVLFFLVTNFTSWLVLPVYPLTWDGLVMAYTKAIPFFRGTFFSTLGFSAVLFGSLALADRGVPELGTQSSPAG